jgi:hypothetical protein
MPAPHPVNAPYASRAMVKVPRCRSLLGLCLFFGLGMGGVLLRGQAISVTDTNSTFNSIVLPSGSTMTDPFADQQTGQPQADFVSLTAGTTGVYVNGAATTSTLATDVSGLMVKSGQVSGDAVNTYMMFRFRFLDANQSKPYEGSVTVVGIDLTGDGKPDIMVGVDSRNATPALMFLKPGTGTNDSPSNTTVAAYTTTASTTLTSGTTFNYAAAGTSDNYDIAAPAKGVPAHTNMLETFAISFATLQQAIRDMGTVNGTNFSTFTVTATTPMSFLAYTSQQGNAFNQDIFGGAITSSSSGTWTSLGAFSDLYTASGSKVPESSTVVQLSALILAALGLGWMRRRKVAAEAVVAPRIERLPAPACPQ